MHLELLSKASCQNTRCGQSPLPLDTSPVAPCSFFLAERAELWQNTVCGSIWLIKANCSFIGDQHPGLHQQFPTTITVLT
jgi:hypothetical protein